MYLSYRREEVIGTSEPYLQSYLLLNNKSTLCLQGTQAQWETLKTAPLFKHW